MDYATRLRLDYNVQKRQSLRKDRRASVQIDCREEGVVRRWMCAACAKKWRSTQHGGRCPFCKAHQVMELASATE